MRMVSCPSSSAMILPSNSASGGKPMATSWTGPIFSVIVRLLLLSVSARYRSLLRVLVDLFRQSRSSYAWDLVSLGIAGRPVADVEQDGEDHPEPVEAHKADTGRVDDYVDKGREREEDKTQQRQEEGVERRGDEGWSGDPDYEQREAREKASE